MIFESDGIVGAGLQPVREKERSECNKAELSAVTFSLRTEKAAEWLLLRGG